MIKNKKEKNKNTRLVDLQTKKNDEKKMED